MKLPQLHVRDLFWLVCVVAMGCGWWLDRRDGQARADYEKGLLVLQRDNWKDQVDLLRIMWRESEASRKNLSEQADQLEGKVRRLEAVNPK